MTTFPARVADRAASISLVRVLLTVLAVPFYVLGLVVGLVIVSARWALSAVIVGVVQVRGEAVKPKGSDGAA